MTPTGRPEDLPIPADVQPGKGWSPLMLDMAEHIGAHAVLVVIDRLGGLVIDVPRDPTRGPFTEVVGPEKSAIISAVYGRERLALPTGKAALAMARRAGVLAAVRANELTAGEAARILRTSRRYVSELLNTRQEGLETAPVRVERGPDPRQIDLFAD